MLAAVSYLVPELCSFHPLTPQAYEGARHVSSILWSLHTWMSSHDFLSHLQQLCGDLPGYAANSCTQSQQSIQIVDFSIKHAIFEETRGQWVSLSYLEWRRPEFLPPALPYLKQQPAR